MTRTKSIAYGFFAQTIILLILYAAAALFGAAKFLTPHDPLALSLPYNQIGALANLLLHLAALTGLLGGGVYITAGARGDQPVRYESSILQYGFWLWGALLLLAFLAGALGLLEGRNLLELPRLLDVYALVVLFALVVAILANAPRSHIVRVWGVGMVIGIIGMLAGLIQPADYVQDRVLRTLAAGLQLNIAYPIVSAALGFWMIRRFSGVPHEWTDMGVYTVGGLLLIAGVCATLPPLFRLGAGDTTMTLGNIAAILVPVLYLMFASHSYGALSDRKTIPSLAAHWYALSLLLLLLGVGFLGGLQAAPGIGQWTAGTRLTDLQSTLTLLGVTAMGLGVVNQGASELYGREKRINGLTPFWLVAFGIVIGALALGGAGIAQTYMERVLSIGYLDTQTLVIPLYTLWTFGLLLLALGMGIFALTFWLRRPEIEIYEYPPRNPG
jgi:nitric oxide reductase subunit B